MDLDDIPCIDGQGIQYPYHEFTPEYGECCNCDLPEDAYIEPYWDDESYDYWE